MSDDSPAPQSFDDSFDDPFEHRFVTLGDLRFHLVETGPRDGKPVLLLHGFPEHWWGWHHQMPQLAAAGYRVTAPDLRGYNLSDKPRGAKSYGLDALAEDTVRLIDELGADEVLLAGHDWGGAVAWWTAVRFPERIEKLIVMNVPHPVVMRRFLLKNRAQRKKSWYMFFFQLPWLPEWALRRRNWHWATKSFNAIALPGTFSDEDLDRYREAWRRPRAITSMLNWYRAALRQPPGRVPSVRVTVPTTVFWGMQDPALSSDMVEPCLALCDDGRAVEFERLTHWLLHEAPEEVGEAMIDVFAAG